MIQKLLWSMGYRKSKYPALATHRQIAYLVMLAESVRGEGWDVVRSIGNHMTFEEASSWIDTLCRERGHG